jgi:hypothetical protein
MPDEEIDKIVREAANQHHPAYDDTAWAKMESLLDKHLPQKKDRKKPVLFLLLFLLLGVAVFFAINNAGKKQAPPVAENAKDPKPAATEPGHNQPAPTTREDTTDAATTGIEPSQPFDQSAAALTLDKTDKRSHLTNNKQDNADNVQAYADGKKTHFDQKGRIAIKIKKPGISSDDDAVTKETPENNNVANSEDIVSGKINTTGIADVPAVKKNCLKMK